MIIMTGHSTMGSIEAELHYSYISDDRCSNWFDMRLLQILWKYTFYERHGGY